MEKAQNEGLKVNNTMDKNVILEKITNPKLTDLNGKRLRELAKKEGVPLPDQITNKNIIKRLENPAQHYTKKIIKTIGRRK